jgi:hypothetical protein
MSVASALWFVRLLRCQVGSQEILPFVHIGAQYVGFMVILLFSCELIFSPAVNILDYRKA